MRSAVFLLAWHKQERHLPYHFGLCPLHSTQQFFCGDSRPPKAKHCDMKLGERRIRILTTIIYCTGAGCSSLVKLLFFSAKLYTLFTFAIWCFLTTLSFQAINLKFRHERFMKSFLRSVGKIVTWNCRQYANETITKIVLACWCN